VFRPTLKEKHERKAKTIDINYLIDGLLYA